jgi:hypothetical protein
VDGSAVCFVSGKKDEGSVSGWEGALDSGELSVRPRENTQRPPDLCRAPLLSGLVERGV